MRETVGSVLVAVLMGGFAVGAAQLPPEIMADRYLVEAEKLIAEKEFGKALELMNKIVALQQEHNFTLPDVFHFKYAELAFSAGSFRTAIDSVNKYLATAGRDGEFYREALELLVQVEARAFNAAQTCQGKPKGSKCWMELANQPGCYIWDEYLAPDETVTGKAECVEGVAQGSVSLKWVWDNRKNSMEGTGHVQGGKKHGQWVERSSDGDVEEGPYVEGKRHGQWVGRHKKFRIAPGVSFSHRDGSYALFEEGPYVEGKRHGQWVVRDAYGNVGGGPYVEGKRHGQWVLQWRDDEFQKGSYVNGKRHGRWVVRRRHGEFQEWQYVEGSGMLVREWGL